VNRVRSIELFTRRLCPSRGACSSPAAAAVDLALFTNQISSPVTAVDLAAVLFDHPLPLDLAAHRGTRGEQISLFSVHGRGRDGELGSGGGGDGAVGG